MTGNVTYEASLTSATCQNGTQHLTLTPAKLAQLDGRSSDPACATTTCYAPTTNAAAIVYFKTFPLSNSNGAGDGYNTGGYNFTPPAHQITNIARIDYEINSRQTLFVRGNLQSDNQSTSL